MFKIFTSPKKVICYLVLTLCLVACKKEILVEPEEQVTTATISKLALATGSVKDLVINSTLELGIVGHPLGDAPYIATSAAKQIKLLNSMGMTWYRFGISSKTDGTVTVPKLLDPLLIAAKEGKINLLANLRPRTLTLNDTEAASYTKGKMLGLRFAEKYGQYFSHYDLGNDLDLDTKISGKTGRSQEHYDKAKTKVIMAYLKGMDEGIKAGDPGAKTMVAAGWLHYAFLRMCESYGVKFDIVAYHWYSDMEATAPKAPNNIPDITQKLSSLFPDKPIWFTEFNYRYSAKKSVYENETAQKEFITNFITKCSNNPHVKVAMVYELFDEPYKSVQESSYGIAKWEIPYTLWKAKSAMNSLLIK